MPSPWAWTRSAPACCGPLCCGGALPRRRQPCLAGRPCGSRGHGRLRTGSRHRPRGAAPCATPAWAPVRSSPRRPWRGRSTCALIRLGRPGGPCPGTPLPILHGLRPCRLPGGHHCSRIPRLGRPLGRPLRRDAPNAGWRLPPPGASWLVGSATVSGRVRSLGRGVSKRGVIGRLSFVECRGDRDAPVPRALRPPSASAPCAGRYRRRRAPRAYPGSTGRMCAR